MLSVVKLPGALADPLHHQGRGLVGSWQLNEGAGSVSLDATAYANHGEHVDMDRQWQDRDGCRFNSSYIFMPPEGAPGDPNYRALDAVTASAWVYYDALPDNYAIVNDWTNPFCWTLWVLSTSGRPAFYTRKSSTTYTVNGSDAVPQNRWVHLMGSWGPATDNTLTLLVDGYEVFTGQSVDPPLTLTSQRMEIGRQAAAPTTLTDSSMRDLQVWDRSMTVAEMMAMHNQCRANFSN